MKAARLLASGIVVLLVAVSCSAQASEGTHACRQSGTRDRRGPDNDNVVVHLFEWSWKDIARECESLAKWGYWGVQVSPPQEDLVAAEWWSRYQPVSYTLQSRSGSEQDFVSMVRTCTDHGVNIVVDVVINHMANPSVTPGEGRAGTKYNSKCSYEGGFRCQHFHHYDCAGSCGQCRDCNNCGDPVCVGGDGRKDPQHIYNCNLGGLPDLDTSHPEVQEAIAGYLNKLVTIGVAGIRVDAAKHIKPQDLSAILSKVKEPCLFVNQEVILTGDCTCLGRKDYYDNGKIWEFNTPLLFHDVFMQPNSMNKIRDMDSSDPGGWECKWAKSDYAHTFVVNHDMLVKAADRQHTITMFDEGIYSLALMTLLAHPYGQPNILSSINFDYTLPEGAIKAPIINPNDPRSPLKSVFDGDGGCGYWKVPDYPRDLRDMKPYLCEHRWLEVRNMVMWRKVAGLSNTLLFEVYNDNTLAITRGDTSGKAFFVVNAGRMSFQQEINSKMPSGTYCNIVYTGQGSADCFPCKDTCPSKITVGDHGQVSVNIGPQKALAFHKEARVPAPSVQDSLVVE